MKAGESVPALPRKKGTDTEAAEDVWIYDGRVRLPAAHTVPAAMVTSITHPLAATL